MSQFLISGYASLPVRDVEDHLVALKALTWSTLPPLLVEHEEKQVAGKILKLAWDEKGLAITALLDREYKDQGAFSCRFGVLAHRIHGKSRDAYAEVLRGTIREISIVSRPACPGAIITSCVPYVAPTAARAETPITKSARQAEIARLLAEMRS
ncbi:MAG: hypothetical protein E5Y02_10405 [Mesorhizobium sp.]|nr:MAG: hypothetical protein E5Y02_10405 [Mesorhizobium sp.]